MKLIKKNAIGGTKITTEDGAPIASFSNDAIGQFAYGCFVSGLARIDGSSVHADSTLFDADLDQFVVGTVADLVA